MNTLRHFNNFVLEITQSNSRLYKQEILRKWAVDDVVKSYLQIAFNPFKIFGISRKKLDKEFRELPEGVSDLAGLPVLSLFKHLEQFNTGKTKEVLACQKLSKALQKEDDLLAILFEDLLCKKLSIGVDTKTINKEIPNLIPAFNVQLASKYKANLVEGKTFALTTKIDGGRIIALKENGNVSFYTRAGQPYEGLVDLEKEMKLLMPDNTCLDGECTLVDKGDFSSKDQYKETMKIVRTKEPEKHGIKMLVFDYMSASDFKKQECSLPYSKRRQAVEEIFNSTDFAYFELLPILYQGREILRIPEILKDQVSQGEEGIMINICEAPYAFKRTNNLLKCKVFNDMEVRVIDFEEGEGRNAGKLGAFICEYKNNTVRVGSGLTDQEREEIWQSQESYLNKLITINYFEETVNSTTGLPSLRFPTFVRFREI